jgi:hypothetical protein
MVVGLYNKGLLLLLPSASSFLAYVFTQYAKNLGYKALGGYDVAIRKKVMDLIAEGRTQESIAGILGMQPRIIRY